MEQYEGKHLKKAASTGRAVDLRPPDGLSEVFHESTKLSVLSGRAYSAEIAKFLASPAVSIIRHPHKVYSLSPRLPLPEPPAATAVERALGSRRSGRAYTGEALSREEVARLLALSYGVTDRRRGFRAVPSGGALYPLELYLVPLRVDGLDPGVYHYDVERHALTEIERRDLRERLAECVFFTDVEFERAALVVVITAIFERVTIKYKDRGYRGILIEAGEVVQNLYLTAGGMGIGACAMGGFLDDDLGRLLGVDGLQEAPLVPMIFGRAAAGEEG